MTEPVRVGELLPGVIGEVVDRAGHGYQRWAELVAQAGYCHHPIRLAGRVEDDQAVIVVASWVYVGSGYATEGERWLALSAAARAREHRRIAREELTTTTASAA
jgi:hypothetical protein